MHAPKLIGYVLSSEEHEPFTYGDPLTTFLDVKQTGDADPHGSDHLLLRLGRSQRGISGPLLFGKLIEDASASKGITQIAIGCFIGAVLMVGGGLVEAFLGVKAEGQALESIARPLTAEESEHGTPAVQPV